MCNLSGILCQRLSIRGILDAGVNCLHFFSRSHSPWSIILHKGIHTEISPEAYAGEGNAVAIVNRVYLSMVPANAAGVFVFAMMVKNIQKEITHSFLKNILNQGLVDWILKSPQPPETTISFYG